MAILGTSYRVPRLGGKSETNGEETMPDFSFQGIKDAIGSLLGQSTGEDAVSMLIDDHKRVKEIFDTFKDLNDDEKLEAKHKALVELALHAAVEEKLVYPLLREEDEEDEVNEAVVEHHVMKLLIVELEAMKEANAMLDAKFKVLGEIVEHHVKEEESDMFPKLRSSDNDLQALGAEIKSKKEELLGQLGDADDLGKIDPELAPHSNRRDDFEEHSNGTNGKGKSTTTRARGTRAIAGKGTDAKKADAKATSRRVTASSAKKDGAKLSAPKAKKVAAKTPTKKSTTSSGKKVTKKAAASKATAKAKTVKTKTASASSPSSASKKRASATSKTILKSGAKAKQPTASARKVASVKKVTKKSK
jgi:hemerythrin superfamily protein